MVAGFGLCALWGKHDDCEPGGLLSKGFRMLSFPSSVRIFLALQPCDMRKIINEYKRKSQPEAPTP